MYTGILAIVAKMQKNVTTLTITFCNGRDCVRRCRSAHARVGKTPEKALPGICAEKDGKMARSSRSPRGRPMSADIFCCSLPAFTLARFVRCLSLSDSLWDRRGCSTGHHASSTPSDHPREPSVHFCISLVYTLNAYSKQAREATCLTFMLLWLLCCWRQCHRSSPDTADGHTHLPDLNRFAVSGHNLQDTDLATG